MNSKIAIKLIQSAALVGVSLSVMGNSSCQGSASTPARVMARKVQVNGVTAPAITLPAAYGGTFDFTSVATTQMKALLSNSKYFSTNNVDPNGNYTPAGLDADINNSFFNCSNAVPPDQTHAQLLAAGLVHQTKMRTQGSSVGTNINQSYYASCLITVPQASITSGIEDFALVGGGGVTLSASNLSTLGGASFSFSTYSLQVAMSANNPLDIANSAIVSSLQNTYTTNGSASLTLNLGPFSLGPSGYLQTPLSKVVQSGLTKGISDLYTKWNANDPWYATILKMCGTYVYINGSTDLGLQVGDVLAIKNVEQMWYGDVCDSQWAGAVPDLTPAAYAQVVSLGDNIAAAVVIQGNPTYPEANTSIFPGARVYMDIPAAQAANLPGLPMSKPVPTPKTTASTSSSSSTSN